MAKDVALVNVNADAKGFYTYRLTKYIAETEGLERFCYQLLKGIGFGSLAPAFDPLSGFRFSGIKIAPVNRPRYAPMINKTARVEIRTSRDRSWRTPIQTATPFAWDLLPLQLNSDSTTTSTISRVDQELLLNWTLDTTKRTRFGGEDFGEFEKLRGKIRSPGNGWSIVTSEIEVQATSPWVSTDINKNQALRIRRITGPRARFTGSSWLAVESAEQANASVQIQKHKLSVLRRCLPTSRKMGLARSIAELRDLPKTVRTSLEGLMAIVGKGSLKEQPINFLFGWKPFVEDLKRLVDLPEKLTKMVNYRLKRNGQPTTFRTRFSYYESVPNPPAFVYEALNLETNTSTTTDWNRKVTIRGMVNANVRFPLLEIPLFKGLPRDQLMALLYDDLQGNLPRLIDIYNLVPWSWLFDWFTGLGEYLDVVEMINGDDNLINYGFITYVSEGVIRTSYRSEVSQNQRLTVDGTRLIDINRKIPVGHESRFEYSYQLRKSLGSIPGVRFTSDQATLTSYQASIIGALALAKSR